MKGKVYKSTMDAFVTMARTEGPRQGLLFLCAGENIIFLGAKSNDAPLLSPAEAFTEDGGRTPLKLCHKTRFGL